MTLAIVELQEWQDAEPRKCGSCNHFRRSGGVGGDWCNLHLPSWVAIKVIEEQTNNRYMRDSDTCDLWVAANDEGKRTVFVKKVKWIAGEEPKVSE